MTSCVCLALSCDRSYGLADDSPDQHLVLLVCNLHSVTKIIKGDIKIHINTVSMEPWVCYLMDMLLKLKQYL